MVVFLDKFESGFSGDAGTLRLGNAEVALIELVERGGGSKVLKVSNVFGVKNDRNRAGRLVGEITPVEIRYGRFWDEISISGAKIEVISVNMTDDFAAVIGDVFVELILTAIVGIVYGVIVHAIVRVITINIAIFLVKIWHAFSANK